MLTDDLRTMINNLFKENFYGKKKINILTVFSISHKKWCQNFSKMNC